MDKENVKNSNNITAVDISNKSFKEIFLYPRQKEMHCSRSFPQVCFILKKDNPYWHVDIIESIFPNNNITDNKSDYKYSTNFDKLLRSGKNSLIAFHKLWQ